ncbi:deoxyribonuclease gamma-like [Gigantopelta aegis]|uniref:deoxyribonuclease gamma-like n=1 Tax=Gigantopelta aegis TaxID=1735272 RepID=UPI001B888315|nr:deoxyribonuclease gamma-like [Gigantopelta aegis]
MDARSWLVCLLLAVSVSASLKIGAFNIKRLSENTLQSHPGRLDILVKILSRYDIAAIEEVMDTDGIKDILHALNSHGGGPYALELSGRLGSTRYKEHYAFIYRTDRVSVRQVYQYPDPRDYLDREPYSVLFHTSHAAIHDFAIAAVHVKPREAMSEIDHLVTIYNSLKSHFGNENILFAGDFNGDCHYLSQTALHKNHLYTDGRFHWLIPSTADTTVSTHTNCAYDRFVVAGSAFMGAIVSGSAKAFNYQKAYHMNFNQAWDVSDHYPIELELR